MKSKFKDKKVAAVVQNVMFLCGVIAPKYGKRFLMSALLVVLASLAEVVNIGAMLPFLAALSSLENNANYGWIGGVADLFGIKPSADPVQFFAIMFIVAAIVAALLKVALIRSNSKLSFLIARDLSADIYKKTLYQPYGFHVQTNSSEIINGVVDKADNTMGAVLMLLSLIGSLGMAFAIFIGLIIIDWKATVATFFGFSLIYFCIFRRFQSQLLDNGTTISQGTINVIRVLQEGIGSIRDILIEGSQEVHCQVFKNVDEKLRRARMENYFISTTPRYFVETIGIVLFVMLAYFLSRKDGGLASAIPILGALALGAQKLLPNLQQVYQGWSNLVASYPSLCETVKLLRLPILESHKSEFPPLEFINNIAFNNVDFCYPNGRKIIENVSFQIRKGARIGVVGESGSGKSTLLDLLMGLLVPTAGEILVDDVPLDLKNVRRWQRVISHVPQHIFIKDASIEENIAFGVDSMDINHTQVLKSAKAACISNDIEKMQYGLKSRTGERGALLSGGQRQRIAIARALYKHSKIIILDEATSALDSETELKVVQNLHSYDPDLTIIMVSHRPSSLDGCNIILKVENGRIDVQSFL